MNVEQVYNFSSRKSGGQFLSSSSLVGKKDRGSRPVINLKELNKVVHYACFKMEGLFLLEKMLLTGEFMCKIALKDAYLLVPLSKKSKKYVRFEWKGLLYKFLCLCFGLSSAPRVSLN